MMIVLVRKFSVTYQGKKHQVLYIHDDENGMLHYCIASPDGDQFFIEAQNVTAVHPDD